MNGVALPNSRAIRPFAGPVRCNLDEAGSELWQARRVNSAARQSDGRYEVIVHGFDGVSSSKIEALLTQQVPGLEITMRSERAEAAPYVRARTDAASLDALLRAATAIDGVQFVLPWVSRAHHQHRLDRCAARQCDDAVRRRGAICDLRRCSITASSAAARSSRSPTPVPRRTRPGFATLDKGNGPHTEVTFSDNPPPVLPNPGTLHPDNKIIG